MENFSTFYRRTSAIFYPCATPDRKPDFISASGSKYWDEGHGVIRSSDHWGDIADCDWWVNEDTSEESYTGYCPYTGFQDAYLYSDAYIASRDLNLAGETAWALQQGMYLLSAMHQPLNVPI